jgi:hypothetical protein
MFDDLCVCVCKQLIYAYLSDISMVNIFIFIFLHKLKNIFE